MKTIKVSEDESGQRLDYYLSKILLELSRTKIQSYIKSSAILVNKKPVKASVIVCSDDVITIEMKSPAALKIEPQNITLDIHYEDEHMLVVNKPFGMLTHPTINETTDTLVNALLFYTKGELSDVNGGMRQGILHRLDRNTSGLLMVAKNDAAHEFLAEQIKTKKAIRKYLTVVSGKMPEGEGLLEFPMGRHPSKPEKMAVVEDGKPAKTFYKVIEEFKGYSYLELELYTGRTHQIRVHLSHLKHPIVNDTLYGGERLKLKTTEQVLQAYCLSFLPMGKKDDIMIQVSLDADIQRVLKYLRSKK